MMTQEQRIKPEDIPDLYRKHDVSPLQCEWFTKLRSQEKHCACLVTILLIDKVPGKTGVRTHVLREMKSGIFTTAKRVLGLSEDYLLGLTYGFDVREPSTDYVNGSDFKLGQDDGNAALIAIMKTPGLEIQQTP